MSRESRVDIVLVLVSGARGGTEQQAIHLAAGLKSRGIRVEVWFLRDAKPLAEQLAVVDIPYRAFGGNSDRPNVVERFRAAMRLARAVFHVRPRLMHAFLPEPLLVTSLALRALRLRRKIALVAGVRSSITFIPSPLRPAYRWAVLESDAMACNAEYLVHEFAKLPKTVSVIPNGLDTDVPQAQPALVPARAVVVANLLPYKGYDLLLDALQMATPCPLVTIVGQGPLRQSIERLIVERRMAGQVSIADQPADVPSVIAQAQFAIHPSRVEGLSNAILEEMAAGLAVIAFTVGGNSELIESGVNGVLVPAFDVQELAKAIGALAADPQRCVVMGASARDRALQYSWPSTVGRQVALYELLMNARAPELNRNCGLEASA